MLTTIEGADAFYHYDTPLTIEHGIPLLSETDFAEVHMQKTGMPLTRFGYDFTSNRHNMRRQFCRCLWQCNYTFPEKEQTQAEAGLSPPCHTINRGLPSYHTLREAAASLNIVEKPYSVVLYKISSAIGQGTLTHFPIL